MMPGAEKRECSCANDYRNPVPHLPVRPAVMHYEKRRAIKEGCDAGDVKESLIVVKRQRRNVRKHGNAGQKQEIDRQPSVFKERCQRSDKTQRGKLKRALVCNESPGRDLARTRFKKLDQKMNEYKEPRRCP